MNSRIEQYLYAQATEKKIPLKMTLEITPLCNLKCKMCYVRESYDKVADHLLSLDYWILLIKQMKDAGTLFVALIGGEPMTHPHIREIYEEILKNGMYVNLTTNGTMFAYGVPEWMIEQKPRYITVSLYGASNDTYKRLTGHSKGYDLAIKGIEMLMSASIPVQINFCVTKDNYDDLPVILEFARENGLKILATTYEYPNYTRHTHVDNGMQDRLSVEKTAKAQWLIERTLHLDSYEDKVKYFARGCCGKNTPRNKNNFTCRAGSTTGWITWNGMLCCCGLIDAPAIDLDLNKNIFSMAWNSLTKTIANLKISEHCAVCDKRDYCAACPAKIKAETGSFLGKPEYICKMTDASINEAKKLIATMMDN